MLKTKSRGGKCSGYPFASFYFLVHRLKGSLTKFELERWVQKITAWDAAIGDPVEKSARKNSSRGFGKSDEKAGFPIC